MYASPCRGAFALLIALLCIGTPRVGSTQTTAQNPLQLAERLPELVRRIEPSVVQIFTTGYGGSAEDPTSLYAQRRSTGSGVVLDASGYIVTNAHVVEGARRVQVLLAEPPTTGPPDSRSILAPRGEVLGAQVVGTDFETDLAVLKVSRSGLPALRLADSDSVRQGQLVFAFGSPLGLANSVTMGVVSSVARQLRDDDPMIYIQSDAAVNPGNSGGPLVDVRGRVVGINTFIFTQSGGSEGLSFAAPSNIVRNVFDQIRTTGRVRRGMIGVHAQTLNPVLAKGLGLTRNWGVLLGDVYPGGPAEAAGLRPGDIVLRLDGKIMENGRQLSVNLYGMSVGARVKLDVLRNGREQRYDVQVIERPDDPQRFADLVRPDQNAIRRLGILGLDLDRRISSMFGGLRFGRGIVVASVLFEITSWGPGFATGDVIYSVNGRSVGTVSEVRDALAKLVPGDPVVVQVERLGRLVYLAFELDA